MVRASELRDAGKEVDLFVYYTGHAGVDGLHMHGETLSLDELKAAHPELVTAIREEGFAAGAADERERVTAHVLGDIFV